MRLSPAAYTETMRLTPSARTRVLATMERLAH